MFSIRQIKSIPCVSVSLETFVESPEIDSETGRASFVRSSDFDVLPDKEDYDLDKMIKAGVPLQETRTNVLRPDVDGLVDALDKEDIFKKPEDEVKNEQ